MRINRCLAFLLIVVFLPKEITATMQAMTSGYVQFPTMQNMYDDDTFNTLVIDAASEKVAGVFQACKTGTINKIGFGTGTVTTGADLDVRLETVSTTDGDPSGTLATANSNATQTVADTNDNTWFLTTLTAGHAATQGDVLAAVVVNDPTTPGNMQIRTGPATQLMGSVGIAFKVLDHFTTAWTKQNDNHSFYIEYDDATTCAVGSMPIASQTETSFGTSSAADEIGNIFQFPFKADVCGAWVPVEWNAADFDVILYDSDGSTALQTLVLDGNLGVNRVNNDYFSFFLFSGSSTLSANTNYRIVLKPTTTSTIAIDEFNVNSATIMDAFDGGQEVHKTSRADAGAWTQTTTSRVNIGILMCGFDDGAGGSAATTGNTFS